MTSSAIYSHWPRVNSAGNGTFITCPGMAVTDRWSVDMTVRGIVSNWTGIERDARPLLDLNQFSKLGYQDQGGGLQQGSLR